MNKPIMLCIMDGFGLAPDGPGNAIAAARTPNLDRLFAEMPCTKLQASGEPSACPTDRWAIPRSDTPTWGQAASCGRTCP